MPRSSSRLLLTILVSAAFPLATSAQLTSDPIAASGFVKEFGTMWTFDAPPLAYWKAAYNFAPTQEWLDQIRLAAVRIPGCSASIVSDRGLILTNHHCARACITAASPPETDYQAVGFVAPRDEAEPSCPGMTADQLQSMEDVTAAIRQAVTARATADRVAQRDGAIERIQSDCSRETGLICQVVTFYQGGMYSLYRYKRYTDLRLVMAPEGAISFFGGDPDNFTYPRYALDITFLRIYHDGKPLAAEHYLRWNAAGADEGDVVFVVGNPGSTGRMLTMAQMEFLRDVQYPMQLALLEANTKAYRALSTQSEDARRRYENAIFSAENAIKAVTGYRSGLLNQDIMSRKARFETEFRRRVAADPTLRAQFGGAWDLVARAQRELGTFATARQFQSFAGSQLLAMAGNLSLLPGQQALPDGQRLTAFQGPGLDRIRGQLGSDIHFDLDLEEALLAAQLSLAQAALPGADPFLKAALVGKSPSEAARALVRGTELASTAARKALVEGGAQMVAASADPMMVLARAIAPMVVGHGMRAQSLASTVSANAELLGQAIFAAYGRSLPPDATFTLRISDGVVQGFPMNGTIAPYRTSFYGLFARSAEFGDQGPFHLPTRWKTALGRLDLSTPYNFVSTADIIGGNSGSPLVNRQGEVVGVAFDGNIEMLPNRFVFTDEVSRTVSVHAAAITEALRKVYQGGRIATELERAAIR